LEFRAAAGLVTLIIAIVITAALPLFHRYFIAPPQELAAIAGLNLDREGTLASYGNPKPSLLFYARGDCSAKPCIEMIKPGEEEKFQALFIRPGQLMILTQERLRARLPPPASAYPVILSRHGYVLLAKEPVL
jgi:hypothetical protein